VFSAANTARCSGNRLTALPEALSQLRMLRRLELDRNQLQGLPPSLGALDYLEEVGLAGNRIALKGGVPPPVFGMARLAWLSLAANGWAAPQGSLEAAAVTLHQLDVSSRLELRPTVEAGHWRTPRSRDTHPRESACSDDRAAQRH
jgi:Leucine-rich repeat (LRR) protein